MKLTINSIAILLVLLMASCQKNELKNQAIATGGAASDFTYTPDTANSVDIKFINTLTDAATTFSWDFGDGKYATGQNPSHRYDSAGSYPARLTVTSKAGVFTTDKVVAVSASNFILTTNDATDELTVSVVNRSVNCTNYKWQWGDSSETLTESPGSHTFTSSGVYTVKLSATLANSTVVTSKEVKVFVASKNNLATAAGNKWKYHPSEGLSFSGSYSSQTACELASRFIFFTNNDYQCANMGSEIVFPNCTAKPARPLTTWTLSRIDLLSFKINIGEAGISFLGDPVTGPDYTLVNLTDTLMEFDKVNFGFTDEVRYKMVKVP